MWMKKYRTQYYEYLLVRRTDGYGFLMNQLSRLLLRNTSQKSMFLKSWTPELYKRWMKNQWLFMYVETHDILNLTKDSFWEILFIITNPSAIVTVQSLLYYIVLFGERKIMLGFRLHPFVMVPALQILLVVEGFQNDGLSSTNHHHSLQRRSKPSSSWRLFNSDTDDDNDDDGFSLPKSSSSPISSQLEAGTFNPLKYRASSGKPFSSSTSQVSLRSFRMTQVTTDLLNSIDDEKAIRTILEDNEDFLLEPLEEEDAVAVRISWRYPFADLSVSHECGLNGFVPFIRQYCTTNDVLITVLQGSDSIYTPGMSRAERYKAYRKSGMQTFATCNAKKKKNNPWLCHREAALLVCLVVRFWCWLPFFCWNPSCQPPYSMFVCFDWYLFFASFVISSGRTTESESEREGQGGLDGYERLCTGIWEWGRIERSKKSDEEPDHSNRWA